MSKYITVEIPDYYNVEEIIYDIERGLHYDSKISISEDCNE